MTANEYQDLFHSFSQKRILIIGDVMLDAYLYGKVDRISPEAPVPIVAVNRRETRLGGAANVALNVKALGAEALLLSFVGNDHRGDEFMSLMKNAGLNDTGILKSDKRITTTKFRVIGNNTQMLRVDEEMDSLLEARDQERLLQCFDTLVQEYPIDAIIFQDYDKGVISPEVIEYVVQFARKSGIPVSVDPKHRNFFSYRYVTLFKPNMKELKDGLKRDDILDDDDMARAVKDLQEILHSDLVLVTRSEKGVFIRKSLPGADPEQYALPAIVRHIADVSGAGDTVISVATLCLTVGLDIRELASLSNRAGGLVCEEVGVVPVDRDKLLTELMR